YFFSSLYVDLRYPHSFPTRRSSDLSMLTSTPTGYDPGPSMLTSTPTEYDPGPLIHASTINDYDLGPPTLDTLQIITGPGSYSVRSEEHTSELQSRRDLVCRLLLEKK